MIFRIILVFFVFSVLSYQASAFVLKLSISGYVLNTGESIEGSMVIGDPVKLTDEFTIRIGNATPCEGSLTSRNENDFMGSFLCSDGRAAEFTAILDSQRVIGEGLIQGLKFTITFEPQP